MNTYRIWRIHGQTGNTDGRHVTDKGGTSPLDALKRYRSVSTLITPGRYLVTMIASACCAHDGFGLFDVTEPPPTPPAEYTEVRL